MIDCGAGGHGPGDPRQTFGIAGHACGMVGQNRQAVAGGNEAIAAQYHVAVAVAVGGGAEVRAKKAAVHDGDQVGGVCKIGVGVSAAEIG